MVLPLACLFLLVACSGLLSAPQAQMTNDASDSEQDVTAYHWNEQTNQLSAETNNEGQLQADEKAIQGHVNTRSKRAVSTLTGWFLRQWKHIISNAKLVKKDGIGKEYQKNGDYNNALADFRSLKPTSVRNIYFKGEIKGQFGWVGDTAVAVRKPTQRSREVFNIHNPYLAVIYGKDAKSSTRFIEYIDK